MDFVCAVFVPNSFLQALPACGPQLPGLWGFFFFKFFSIVDSCVPYIIQSISNDRAETTAKG